MRGRFPPWLQPWGLGRRRPYSLARGSGISRSRKAGDKSFVLYSVGGGVLADPPKERTSSGEEAYAADFLRAFGRGSRCGAGEFLGAGNRFKALWVVPCGGGRKGAFGRLEK